MANCFIDIKNDIINLDINYYDRYKATGDYRILDYNDSTGMWCSIICIRFTHPVAIKYIYVKGNKVSGIIPEEIECYYSDIECENDDVCYYDASGVYKLLSSYNSSSGIYTFNKTGNVEFVAKSIILKNSLAI